MLFPWNEAVRILSAGGRFVLAGVTGKSGSSPAAPGAVMIVGENGVAHGTVGGGVLEAAALEAARRLLVSGGGEVLRFDLGGEDAAASGMICGGTTDVFLYAAGPEDAPLFAAAVECISAGEQGFLLFKTGGSSCRTKFSADPDREENGWGDAMRIPLRGASRLFLFGCGHVGVETARIAALVDFAVVALDDRAEFVEKCRFPGTTAVLIDSFEPLPALGIGADSSVVIATRGHLHDIAVLDQMLKTNAGYIGMIGSRRKREMTRSRLVEMGHARESFDRVHSPVGLDIGSETPAEIAVSIVAELVRERALCRKTAASKKE